MALVVTIVVLLILAGVSINLVLDNNGIITRAGDARDKTQIEAIKEAKEMYEVEKYLGTTEESLADYLYKQGVISEAEKEIVNAGGTIEKGDYSVSFEAAAKTIVQAFNDGELEVGDWVNYQNPTSIAADVKSTDENYTDTSYTSLSSRTGMSTIDGCDLNLDQTYSLTNNGKQVNWRILGLSEDGTQLMLTTGSPLQRDYNTSADLSDENNPYFYLYGAKGCAYEYGIKELNKICAIYKNNLAAEARSLTIDDINRLNDIIVDVENGMVTAGSDNTENIDSLGSLGLRVRAFMMGASGGSSSTDGSSSDNPSSKLYYKSPEAYIEGKGTTSNFSQISDAYKYSWFRTDLIFGTSEDSPYTKYYWLASRSLYGFSHNGIWGPGCTKGDEILSCSFMFHMDGTAHRSYAAVRPIVYLRSDVTVDDLQKITEPTTGEEDWNYSW